MYVYMGNYVKIKKNDNLSKKSKKGKKTNKKNTTTCKDNLRTLFVEIPRYKGQWTGLCLYNLPCQILT